jgi:hypothetical protein
MCSFSGSDVIVVVFSHLILLNVPMRGSETARGLLEWEQGDSEEQKTAHDHAGAELSSSYRMPRGRARFKLPDARQPVKI